jgi:mono/diheme cytochrome c family protein
MLLVIAGLGLAVTLLSGEESDSGRIFTAKQAASGRVAYEKSCGRCHTLTLMGRKGDPDELPTVSSLSEADRQFLADYDNRVPPLAGKAFLQRWGSKTAAQLVARFQEAKFSFKEAGLTDDEDIVRITAYVLEVNGAKPGDKALTRTTAVIINSAVE